MLMLMLDCCTHADTDVEMSGVADERAVVETDGLSIPLAADAEL